MGGVEDTKGAKFERPSCGITASPATTQPLDGTGGWVEDWGRKTAEERPPFPLEE